MHRIVRTALATMGAAVVVAGGSLGVAYATTPSSDPSQTASSNDADQVAALNKQADDLLSKIAALQKQLAAATAPTASPSTLTKQELAQTTYETSYSPSPTTATTSQAPASSGAAATAPSTAQKTDERDTKNGDDTDD